jgi:hypothetical protein
MLPVYLMGFIGVTAIFAAGFYKYLSMIDMLPQGTIEENKEGEKQETLTGNYIPFGPSLAVAALIVAFYEPLIRELALWFANGGGPMNLPAYRTIGDDFVRQALMG